MHIQTLSAAILILAATISCTDANNSAQDSNRQPTRYLAEVELHLKIPSDWQQMDRTSFEREKEAAASSLQPERRDEIVEMLVTNPNSAYIYPPQTIANGIYIQRLNQAMPLSEDLMIEILPMIVEVFKEQPLTKDVTILESGFHIMDDRRVMSIQSLLEAYNTGTHLQRQAYLVIEGSSFTYQFVFRGYNHTNWLDLLESAQPSNN